MSKIKQKHVTSVRDTVRRKRGFVCVCVFVCVCGGGGADLSPLPFVCIRKTTLSVENFYSCLSLLFLFAPPTHPN